MDNNAGKPEGINLVAATTRRFGFRHTPHSQSILLGKRHSYETDTR